MKVLFFCANSIKLNEPASVCSVQVKVIFKSYCKSCDFIVLKRVFPQYLYDIFFQKGMNFNELNLKAKNS